MIDLLVVARVAAAIDAVWPEIGDRAALFAIFFILGGPPEKIRGGKNKKNKMPPSPINTRHAWCILRLAACRSASEELRSNVSVGAIAGSAMMRV
ncbi:MAG TPA: hypothetical protein VM659_27140 [Dongiaceae bacterium]|nr:hypothetical protein [Dongiaceae bacterium]